MTAAPRRCGGVGDLLRSWRASRRLSQLDLALQAGVSQRHLSFVEIGRAQPSRELVLQLATHLSVPLRDRNALLLASGYAPVYPETSLNSEELRPVRHALRKLLSSHEPFPATVVDRGWNLVWANKPAWEIFTDEVAAALLTNPPNAIRVALHPEGLAPRVLNFPEYATQLLTRLQRQVAIAPDPPVVALYDEVQRYPAIAQLKREAVVPNNAVFVPMRVRALGGQELAFFSTIATFGTAVDITMAELSIESYFPADKTTTAALHAAYS